MPIDPAVCGRIGELNLGTTTSPGIPACMHSKAETPDARQMVPRHDLLTGTGQNEDPQKSGGPVQKVIADWLRISCAEAAAGMRDAEQLAPRCHDGRRHGARNCRQPRDVASGDARSSNNGG